MSKRGHKRHLTQAECDRIKLLSTMYDYRTVCSMAGISSGTLCRVKQRGFIAVEQRLRPMPSDFKLLAEGKSLVWVCRTWGCHTDTAMRWRKEAGFGKARMGNQPIPIPHDFVATYTANTMVGSARHYGVDVAVIRRWRDELRLPRKVAKPVDHKGWAETYFLRQAA